MVRKVALLLVVFLLFFIPSPASAKSYFAERYDVVLTVLPSGDMQVTETIVFNFQGGPFTYVFRHLALTRTDGIDQIAVSMDGMALPEGNAPGQVEIIQGDPIKVTWHFEPVSDSTHTFELSYRVKGVIRSGAADTLMWIAIPQEHEYEINNSLIALKYPDSVALADPPTLEGAAAQGEAGQGVYRFIVKGIPADRPLTITATFPPGSLIQSPPRWQQYDQKMSAATNAALPIGITTAVITLGVFCGLLYSFLRRNRRENFIPPETEMRLVSPPSKTSPLMAVKLMGGVSPVLALLFDLAQRGYLTIEEEKGALGSKKFMVRRLPKDDPLQPIEQIFMQSLYHNTKGERDRISLAEVINKTSIGKAFPKALDQALVEAGWIDPIRKKWRDRWIPIWVTMMVLAGFCFAGGFVVAQIAGIFEREPAVTP